MTNPEDDQKRVIEQFDRLLSGDAFVIPEDIATWLGRAMLLYGVPFNYLVPDEAMLPTESIRFFSLDPGWLKCLLEGACSVGRQATMDQVLDEYLRNNFLELAGARAKEVRAGQKGKLHFLELAGARAKEVRAGQKGKLHWPLTGFLMRSALVEGWQGLEMKAAGVDAQGNRVDPLEPLRLDRLGPDIMLCIFNGKVTHIEIKQPPEGLHFGASAATEENRYQKISLRRLYPAGQAGDQVPAEEIGATDVPMREGVARVIDIRQLAEKMKNELNRVRAIDGTPNGRFTSAEFGVQMVESPGKAVFKSES